MNDNRKRQEKKETASPSRTIFLRNVQFDTLEAEVRSIFEAFGDIRSIFDLIAKRGLAFITFYDLRSAENAAAALQKLEFKGRKADIHYSIPKDNEKDKNQGSLTVKLNESKEPLVVHSLFEHMARFGEIKGIRDDPSDIEKKIVSYWDSRACDRAMESLENNGAFEGGHLTFTLGWDEGQEPGKNIQAPVQNVKRERDQPQRTRSRSRSPRRDRGRDNRNDRSERNERGDRNRNDGRRNDRDRDHSRNDQAQGEINLMEILSKSKGNQPAQPVNYAPPNTGYAPPQSLQTNQLMALLQSQGITGAQPAQLQQLVTLLSQLQNQPQQSYQQPQQPQQSLPPQPFQPQQQQYQPPPQQTNDPRLGNFQAQPATNYSIPPPTIGRYSSHPLNQGQSSFPYPARQDNRPIDSVAPPQAQVQAPPAPVVQSPTGGNSQLQALAAILMQTQQPR